MVFDGEQVHPQQVYVDVQSEYVGCPKRPFGGLTCRVACCVANDGDYMADWASSTHQLLRKPCELEDLRGTQQGTYPRCRSRAVSNVCIRLLWVVRVLILYLCWKVI
jgi:hypothetical protein